MDYQLHSLDDYDPTSELDFGQPWSTGSSLKHYQIHRAMGGYHDSPQLAVDSLTRESCHNYPPRCRDSCEDLRSLSNVHVSIGSDQPQTASQTVSQSHSPLSHLDSSARTFDVKPGLDIAPGTCPSSAINQSVPLKNRLCIEASEPSNTFFQRSRNVSINGGQFNGTMGHQTNLTVHFGQFPLLPTESSPTICARSELKGLTNVCKPCDSCSVNPTGTRRNEMQRNKEVYEKQLCMKGRGFPLWIPEPNRRLPMAYRKEGVNIGDVGVITPSGGFSFLFNICLSADDPINLGRVPADFEPIYPRLEDNIDICEFFEFKQGNYLAGPSVKISKSDSFLVDFIFESSASGGAILTMPEGAISLDLENIPHFRAYAAANLESWYRFANGPRGREAKNGDIRLVTGCDKTSAWGMAVLSDASHEKNILRFKTANDPWDPSNCPYTWECSGIVEARVGPDRRETDDLRRQEGNQDSVSDGKFLNQCLFVRTLNLTLGTDTWNKLNMEVTSKVGFTQTHDDRGTKDAGSADQHTPQEGISSPLGGESSYHGTSGQSTSSTSNISSFHHPSAYLNELLLEYFPTARMVITHDAHWSSSNWGIAISSLPKEETLRRILSKYSVILGENGVLFLDAKNSS